MSQVNINTGPPADDGGTPPPQPPSRWPLYAFVAVLIVLLLAGLAFAVAKKSSQSAPPATPTATPKYPAGAATATASVKTVVATTPLSPHTAPAATKAAAPAPTRAAEPVNPTTMRVASGSCSNHRIIWNWSGAQRSTSYDVVVYDPRSGATVKTDTTTNPSYTLNTGPGAAVALKVRGHNGSGPAASYFTPGSTGHVPFMSTNPTTATVSVTDKNMQWQWSGDQHANGYDLQLFHYVGGTAQQDTTAHSTSAHWSTTGTSGNTYHLKIRSTGDCPPTSFYTAPSSATLGSAATPTSAAAASTATRPVPQVTVTVSSGNRTPAP